MWTAKFWKDATERVLATVIVVFLAVAGGTQVASEVNWEIVSWTTGLAGLGTFLKCLLASRKGDPTSASLVE